jgi:hypothetical protein
MELELDLLQVLASGVLHVPPEPEGANAPEVEVAGDGMGRSMVAGSSTYACLFSLICWCVGSKS